MSLPQVLIVDDEPEIREVIGILLGAEFEMIEAADGKEALEIVRTRHIDVVLSDYNMPRVNGLELLRSISEIDPRIPVIWLTGRDASCLDQKSWSFGVYEYLEKPFRASMLRECVLSALDFRENFLDLLQLRHMFRLLFSDPSAGAPRATFRSFQLQCREQGLSAHSMIERIAEEHAAKLKSA